MCRRRGGGAGLPEGLAAARLSGVGSAGARLGACIICTDDAAAGAIRAKRRGAMLQIQTIVSQQMSAKEAMQQAQQNSLRALQRAGVKL